LTFNIWNYIIQNISRFHDSKLKLKILIEVINLRHWNWWKWMVKLWDCGGVWKKLPSKVGPNPKHWNVLRTLGCFFLHT